MTSSGAEVLCPYLHVMVAEMIKPVSFCYLFSVVPKASSETSLKASSSIDSSALMSAQFSIIQSRDVSQLKSKM